MIAVCKFPCGYHFVIHPVCTQNGTHRAPFPSINSTLSCVTVQSFQLPTRQIAARSPLRHFAPDLRPSITPQPLWQSIHSTWWATLQQPVRGVDVIPRLSSDTSQHVTRLPAATKPLFITTLLAKFLRQPTHKSRR